MRQLMKYGKSMLIITMICLLVLTGCTESQITPPKKTTEDESLITHKDTPEERKARKVSLQVVETLCAGDAEEIKALFADAVIAEFEDFDCMVQELIEFWDGTSFEPFDPKGVHYSVSKHAFYQKETAIFCWVNVITESSKYEVRMGFILHSYRGDEYEGLQFLDIVSGLDSVIKFDDESRGIILHE